jgi:hypothetical protein
MANHRNYYELEADNNRELGLRRGELFGESLRRTLQERRRYRDWLGVVARAKPYLEPSEAAFPQFIEELRGYAEAAGVEFNELWALSLEDEVSDDRSDRCTTVVTNHGSLVAHNEDWDEDAENYICVVRKRVGDLRSFELYYLNTLGGNAISINSNGYIHAVNSLTHTDTQVGIPKNIIARWLSETSAPDADFEQLTKLKRASGFHHTIVSLDGRVWSIECSATKQTLVRPDLPFVHTNHFLTELKQFEGNRRQLVPGTRTRYRQAEENVAELMSFDDVEELVSDDSEGDYESVFNERTIGRAIFDVRSVQANIWLLREENKGWLSYDLRSLFQS